MKVVFLDIDGVLNSRRSFIAFSGIVGKHLPNEEFIHTMARTTIDPVAVGMINALCEETAANIVLSSTHRHFFQHRFKQDKEMMNIKCQHYLNTLGLTANLVGMTPRTDDAFRGEEIDMFLISHPEIEKFVIIDDDLDFHVHHNDYLVHVDNHIGFSANDFSRAVQILNK